MVMIIVITARGWTLFFVAKYSAKLCLTYQEYNNSKDRLRIMRGC